MSGKSQGKVMEMSCPLKSQGNVRENHVVVLADTLLVDIVSVCGDLVVLMCGICSF